MRLRQRIDRLAPLPPAVVASISPEELDRRPSQRNLAEAWNESTAVLEQRLSLALADLYQRNVQASGNVEPNQRQEQHEPGGRWLTGNGMAKAAYVRAGPYIAMRVSIAMARKMLERDGGLTGVS